MLRNKFKKISKPCRFRPKASRWRWCSEVTKHRGFGFGSVYRNNTSGKCQWNPSTEWRDIV